MNAESIVIERLGKRFGAGAPAVDDLSIRLPAGAFLVLLGPSGCGKTTTLRMLAGLEEATSGSIRFGDRTVVDADAGTSVPAERRGLGMVFQSYALWPHMTVRANVEWPLIVAKRPTVERRERVTEVLRMLGVDGLAERYPAELSGGQQQRVGIARTIAPRPGVLLFDEPLSNLDARLRVDTRAELVEVHRQTRATSVYVTHDQTEALAMATHIAIMKDGRLEQFGTPRELLERPATAFVAEFLGNPAAVLVRGAVVDGVLRRHRMALARVPAMADGVELAVMYRPDGAVLTADGPGLDVTVLECTPSAGRWVATVALGERRVAIVGDRWHEPGAPRRLALPAAPEAVFGPEGDRVDEAEWSAA